ncbi:sodium-coupled monocarboxylate transporter 1 [Cherax quadricarinatus]|uniref:sodium-coupled monocarboxylate transporter 1 n=1 Tax=Cherax quadricarinatus TaxID=27406 RepID=UPI00237918DD|nr:sodium-coupled monocarboxylate transporter 1-like [Cherax quadricarinatus]XP_053629334.1 sodium-coupled monocarboxylate transporter 1-like [Cherax quadricarinatus]
MDSTETPVTAEEEQLVPKFTPVDYTVFSLMLVASVGIGLVSAIRSRGKASTQEYLLGGKTMSPAPVALSLLGGWISAISILGNPTEIYFYGTQLTTILIGCIPGCLFVAHVILPIFIGHNIVSINEYVHLRFRSRTLRNLSTLCLLLSNFIYMAMCLYAPTVALTTVTELSSWASSLIMGSICTFYITIGGVKAVVYTDVLQTLIMFGGVLLVVIICCVDMGGVANVWSIADRGGRIQFFNFSTSPFERHTFWSTMVLGFYIMIYAVGFNQTTYQRFASVRTLQISQSLLYVFLVGLYFLWVVFYFSGLVAFANYSDCDPLASGKIEKPDQIIPFLVTDKLSHLTGMAGIFVAGVYGGVLSSLSSCVNSFACIIWEDFLKDRPYFRHLCNSSATNVVKLLSLIAGILAVCLSLLVDKLGSIFHVSNSILSAVGGPLTGIFISGMCAPWVNTKGAIVGFIVSFVFNVWVVIGKFVRGGGAPTRLPLSTDGCPENLFLLLNTTATTIVSNVSVTDDVLTTTTAVDVLLADSTLTVTDLPISTVAQGSADNTIYEVSYCYSGVIGIIITFVVSSIVSLCTGAVNPKDTEGTVNPLCGRLYHCVWSFFNSHRTYSVETIKEEESFKMLPSTALSQPIISHYKEPKNSLSVTTYNLDTPS